jgi:hypothetical protein
MNEIVGRLAKIIEDAHFTHDPRMEITFAEHIARATISAMREPTPRMLRMLQAHIDQRGCAINAWQDVIEIALDDEPDDLE